MRYDNEMKRSRLQGILLASSMMLTPAGLAFAAPSNLQGYLDLIVYFINDTLIPTAFAVALLFFFVNITRLFIIDSAQAYKREQARTYALYSIIAFVFITSVWGVIAIFNDALDLNSNEQPICPDYIKDCNSL